MHDKHIQSSDVPVTEFISTVLSEALFCDFSVHCCFQYATFLHSFSKVCLQPHFTIQKDKGSEKQQSLFFFFLSKIVFFHVPSISSPTEPLCHYHVPRAPHSSCSVPPPCCCMHLACTARFTIVLYPHCLVL